MHFKEGNKGFSANQKCLKLDLKVEIYADLSEPPQHFQRTRIGHFRLILEHILERNLSRRYELSRPRTTCVSESNRPVKQICHTGGF